MKKFVKNKFQQNIKFPMNIVLLLMTVLAQDYRLQSNRKNNSVNFHILRSFVLINEIYICDITQICPIKFPSQFIGKVNVFRLPSEKEGIYYLHRKAKRRFLSIPISSFTYVLSFPRSCHYIISYILPYT